MCRLQGEPGAQTDALIVCGLERCHAGLTEAEMERPTSVIALCPNVFTRHREPCCEKMKLFLVFSPSSVSCIRFQRNIEIEISVAEVGPEPN